MADARGIESATDERPARAGRPAAVTAATWVLLATIVLTGVTALLTMVLKDELIASWAAGRSDAGSVEPPAFVPVALTMFVVVALLTAVLVMFFREGFRWARILLSVLVALMAVATLASLRTGPPALFVVLSVLVLALDVAALALLWHRDARTFTAGPAPLPPR